MEAVQAFKTIPSPTLLPTIVPDHREYAEDVGKRTLWVVFFIMILSTIAFIGMTWRVPVQKRLFHVLTTFITLFAAVSYFAMATGDGNSYTSILVHGKHNDFYVYRQIFWARYIDWSVVTPLLLLDLAFLAGVNGAHIIVAVVADVLMILTRLFAAFGDNCIQKWGYYTMGCIFYIVLVYILAVEGRKAAAAKNAKTAKFFDAIGSFTFIIWTLYLVVWGLGDGSYILSVDSEIMAYAVLDVLAMPVFGFWLLITHARSDSTSLGGFWAHGLSNEGVLRLGDDEGA